MLPVGEHPSDVRDTRNRSTPGESTASTLLVAVAVAKVGGGARFGASLLSACSNDGVAGRIALLLSAEVRPQVLKPVIADAADPPDRKAIDPSGANDTALAGAVSGISFNESCDE